VESSCQRGNEHSVSIKFWELPSGCTSVAPRVVLSSTELDDHLSIKIKSKPNYMY
jgi:hypothetical protein